MNLFEIFKQLPIFREHPLHNSLVFLHIRKYNGGMDVRKVAKLANIPITHDEKKDLAAGFTKVLGVLDTLKNIDVTGVEPVSQVTALENVTREDEIDAARTFTQGQALANAKRTHNGYFVVGKIFNET